VLVERLHKEWSARERAFPIDAAPGFTPDGLMMGAGTLLMPAHAEGGPHMLEGHEARMLALLAAAYGRAMEPSVLGGVSRAMKKWREGEVCLAHIHLALVGLHSLADRREAARRLFMVDGLMKAGVSPGDILRGLDLDPTAIDALKLYDPAQPRVPSGSGVTSGQWTKEGSVLIDLTEAAAAFLGRVASVGLRAAATNPAILALGLILVPRNTNLKAEGNVPELPGLYYEWYRDQTRLRLTYSGRSGAREIDAEIGADGLFRDGDRVVARLLPDGTLAIDPGEVSADLADKDGPNLCPTPGKDKPGRAGPPGERDKDYEDQIKRLVNPDNPTPRGYGYQFFNPITQKWVYVDDCQHRTGGRVEIKGDYDDLLDFEPGVISQTKDWLRQSLAQVQSSKGFPVIWVFAQQNSSDFARELFRKAGGGRETIAIGVVPRLGEPR
jgi:hypothetical protein